MKFKPSPQLFYFVLIALFLQDAAIFTLDAIIAKKEKELRAYYKVLIHPIHLVAPHSSVPARKA